jgi:hypothetical protein
MNFDALFRELEKLLPQVNDLISRTKTEHLNIREIYKLIEKINKKLDKKK